MFIILKLRLDTLGHKIQNCVSVKVGITEGAKTLLCHTPFGHALAPSAPQGRGWDPHSSPETGEFQSCPDDLTEWVGKSPIPISHSLLPLGKKKRRVFFPLNDL